ncbi:unnamed protein product, partial [Polarella glacialis]
DGTLTDFDLIGFAEEGLERWAEDIYKKQELLLGDFACSDRLCGLGIDLGGGRLKGETALAALARLLPTDTALVSLHLCDSHLGDDGVQRLAHQLLDAAKYGGALEELKLARNALGDGACESLAKLLEVSTTLRSLDLSGNNIGCVGAGLLAAGLRQNDFLKELDLSCNSVGDDGARWLGAALEVNPYSLEKLDLSGNCLGDASLGAGSSCLEAAFFGRDSALTELRLSAEKVLSRVRDSVPRRGEPFAVRCHQGGAEIRSLAVRAGEQRGLQDAVPAERQAADGPCVLYPMIEDPATPAEATPTRWRASSHLNAAHISRALSRTKRSWTSFLPSHRSGNMVAQHSSFKSPHAACVWTWAAIGCWMRQPLAKWIHRRAAGQPEMACWRFACGRQRAVSDGQDSR